MKTLSLYQLDTLLDLITDETVLCYPTDTIYGLGGLVIPTVITKITQIKQRPPEKSYSIIAPSLPRVHTYFAVDQSFATERTAYQQQFPTRGLTLLLPLRSTRPTDIDFSLLSQTSTIGVRFIDHPLQQIIQSLGKPIITTSANLSGQPPLTHPDQLTADQKKLIDIIIDAGDKDNAPSVIIDYVTQQVVRS